MKNYFQNMKAFDSLILSLKIKFICLSLSDLEEIPKFETKVNENLT